MEGKKQKKAGQRTDMRTIRRTAFIALCGIVAFLVLGGRLFYLQIIMHDKYEADAISQQTRQTVVSAARGTIYDRNGRALAMSATVSNVFVSPAELEREMKAENPNVNENPETIARDLAAMLNVDYKSILEKFKDTESWYKTVKMKVEDDVADKVRAYINKNDLKSVHLETSTKRYYPYSSLACHVIGFVGDDNTGLEGIESMYDSYLAGINGRIYRLKNGWGQDMLMTDFEDYYEAQDGDSLTLTIDLPIQNIVEKYLEQGIYENDVRNGAACIAMNPKTGEILAMASYGNYDLNNYLDVSDDVKAILDETEDEDRKSAIKTDALYRQWRNKALSDTYEPGSVFKTITLAMALEEGLVSEADYFDCEGSIPVAGREPVNCSNRSGHGMQSLAKAVQNSCNCAFVQIGERIGAKKFYEYVNAFGLFNETGVDLAGESGSIWWSDDVFMDPYNHSQLAAASFGQTFAVTPIQMITAVSAACNGGYLMKPYIVSSVEDTDGNTVLVNEPTAVRQVISKETSDTVNKLLETVVTDGGGKNAYVAGYRIAGKTGTSEKVLQNIGVDYNNKAYVVSFCGYAPADDPQVVVLCLLDEPSHSTGRYISGANMAAPVVGNILSEILDYLEYKPQYTEAEREAVDVYVPDLYGWTRANANGAMNYQGLNYTIIGDGNVITGQYPTPYSVVAVGSNVILYAGAEKEEKSVTVPDITGLTYFEAQRRLESYGLFICRRTGATESSLTVGVQYTQAYSETPYGSVIEVSMIDESTIAADYSDLG